MAIQNIIHHVPETITPEKRKELIKELKAMKGTAYTCLDDLSARYGVTTAHIGNLIRRYGKSASDMRWDSINTRRGINSKLRTANSVAGKLAVARSKILEVWDICDGNTMKLAKHRGIQHRSAAATFDRRLFTFGENGKIFNKAINPPKAKPAVKAKKAAKLSKKAVKKIAGR